MISISTARDLADSPSPPCGSSSPRSSPPWAALLLGLVVALGCGAPPLDPPEPSPVPVTSEVVELTSFRPTLETWGKVAASTRTELRAPREGVLRLAPGFRDGLRDGVEVRAGQTVFRLEAPELIQEKLRAELEAEAARAEVERTRRGVEADVMPEVDLDRALIAERLAEQGLAAAVEALGLLEVTAPEAGVLVAGAPVSDGARVSGGEVLASVVAGGGQRVELWIAPERRAELLGEPKVVFLAPGASTVLGEGVVRDVGAEVDEGGALRVVAVVEDDFGLPPSGGGVDVSILLEEVETLTVPEKAIRVEIGAAGVFVLDPVSDHYEARRVRIRTGRIGGGRREVLGGLEAGARIAVDGAELLADGVSALEVEQDEEASKG